MKVALFAFLVACAISVTYAQECADKLKEFRKCVGDNHKKEREAGKAKFAALKPKLDACYTDNGCTPPQHGNRTHHGKHGKGAASSGSGESGGKSGESGGKSSGGKSSGGKSSGGKSSGSGESGGASSGSGERGNSTRRACYKAIRQAVKGKFRECLEKAGVNITRNASGAFKHHFKRGHHFGGYKQRFHHKKENKALEGCAKKEQVRQCKRQVFNSSKSTDEETKAKFDERCKAKDACKAALGEQCKAELEKIKKAFVQCKEEQKAQIKQVRGSIKECENLPQKNKKARGDKKPKEHKDYCKLGYDALKQDLKARWASRKNQTETAQGRLGLP